MLDIDPKWYFVFAVLALSLAAVSIWLHSGITPVIACSVALVAWSIWMRGRAGK